MNLVNEAALMAARRNKRLVTMAEFEDAKDKVMMGAERRSTAMTQAEKELTAYHEAGHAILALNVPAADPLHKATIIPARPRTRHGHAVARGRPLFDELQIHDLQAGDHDGRPRRRGDEVRQGEHHIRCVLRHRPGDQAGARHGDPLGLFGQARPRSPTAIIRRRSSSAIRWRARRTCRRKPRQLIDAEVRRLIDEAYTSATTILTKKKKDWIALAEGLLEYETLSGEEIKQLIAGQKRPRATSATTRRPAAARPCRRPARRAKRKKGSEPEGGMEPQPQG